MRYCLIGCGRVSPEHLRAAQGNGLELAALCDVDLRQVKVNLGFAASALAAVPLYEDYREMLRAQKPALVAIASPSGLHAQMALDCIEAGAHVIIEKPVAMTVADAEKIEAAARRKRVVVSNNLQNRFNPAVQALRLAVEQGRFGRILNAALHLRWHRGGDYYRQAAWRGTVAHDGGAMMNQGVHGIDLLNWMLGSRPAEITAFTGRLLHNIEAEDIGMALLRYRHGALASLECMTVMYPAAQEETLQINGTKGSVRLGGKCADVAELWRFEDAAPGEEEAVLAQFSSGSGSVYGHGHSLLYADVLAAIAQGRAPLVGVRQGKRAAGIVLAAYESAKTGKPVAFPADF
ncbi:MAG: Gfo/Idh/MocA family oxidoreductase [Oscillospiraceae bacterium]|jgi:predicted dehydrogenase|nr:Gfo/Idh/MocA family oxidoreductase [Oscillospiraceae bacterium]